MKDFDSVVKTVIAAAVTGLFVWVFNVHAEVKVNQQRISHVEEDQREVIVVVKELTSAVTDLRIVIEQLKK
jgi:dihydroorotase